MPSNIGMGNSPPKTKGASISVGRVTDLATLDISGLTLGTRAYAQDVAAPFLLQISNDAIDHTTVEAVAGYATLRWKKFV